MLLTCGACGKTIELVSDLMEGQHVRCPYCGEKTAFSRPARIALPEGTRAVRQVVPKRSSCETHAEPLPETMRKNDLLETARKPRLGIRRPVEGGSASIDLNAEAIRRNMRDRADEQARAVEVARLARLRARRQALARLSAAILVLVAVTAAGTWGVMKWRAERRQVREAENRKVVSEILARERVATEVRETHERTLAAQEDERRALREKRAEEERKRTTERAQRDAQEAAQRQMLEGIRAHYRSAERLFRGAIVRPWRMLPASKRPGAVAGTFTCAISATAEGGITLFEVVSAENGQISVSELSPREPSHAWALDDYEKLIADKGALIHDGRDTYVLLPKDRAKAIPVPEEGFEPVSWRLGGLDSLMNRLGADGARLRAEVCALDGKNAVGKATYDSGRILSRSDVAAMLRPVAESKEPKPKARRSRVTVELYDGNVIKRGLRKTLVPRSPLHTDRSWESLHEEALRQERELEPSPEALEKRARNVEARLNQMLGRVRLSVQLTTE